MSGCRRPHSGDRARREGAASSTGITRSFARCGNARSTSTSSPSPTRCLPSEKVQEHLALRGLPREKVLPPSGDHARPRHRAEQQLWANHPSESACRRRRKRSAFPFHRQDRQAMVAGRQVPAHREELPGQELLQFVDKAGNCQDATSTDVNDHLKEIIGQGYYSEGLPHLGGNGSRGDGAQ